MQKLAIYTAMMPIIFALTTTVGLAKQHKIINTDNRLAQTAAKPEQKLTEATAPAADKSSEIAPSTLSPASPVKVAQRTQPATDAKAQPPSVNPYLSGMRREVSPSKGIYVGERRSEETIQKYFRR